MLRLVAISVNTRKITVVSEIRNVDDHMSGTLLSSLTRFTLIWNGPYHQNIREAGLLCTYLSSPEVTPTRSGPFSVTDYLSRPPGSPLRKAPRRCTLRCRRGILKQLRSDVDELFGILLVSWDRCAIRDV